MLDKHQIARRIARELNDGYYVNLGIGIPTLVTNYIGLRCVKKIVTELAVLDVLPEGGFRLLETAPGVTIADVRRATAGKLVIADEVLEMDERRP